MKKLLSITSNWQTHYHLKLDFQKVDQHTEEGKWLIHGTKHNKDNQLQSQSYVCIYACQLDGWVVWNFICL